MSNKTKTQVNKIYENQTGTNKTYWVLDCADGHKYSIWNKEERDKINEGDNVNIDFTIAGKDGKEFRNAQKLEKLEGATPEQPKEEMVVEEEVIGEEEKKPDQKYWDKRNNSIIQQTAGKIASNLLANESITPESKLKLWKAMSKQVYEELKEEW